MRASRAFSPPRLAFTTLLISFITCTSSLTQKNLVCIQPGTQTCVIWTVNWNNFIKDIHEIQSRTNLADYCGISNVQDFAHHKLFKIKVQLINAQLKKTIICKQVMRYNYVSEWPDVARGLGNTLRFRRQEFTPRGRYRGQTQSQYLAIDRGNGKDEGKAEAHSAADTSRASVSGNSGMGQAQSQSVFDPNCDGCYGRSVHEVENLKRPSGFRTEQSGSVWPNKDQGPSYKDNGRFNPVSTIYPMPVSSGDTGKPNGSNRPIGPIGLPGVNEYSPTAVGRGYTPNGIVTGPTGIGAYGPGIANGNGRGIGSYNPSKTTGREGYSPSGTTGVVYRPDGTSEVGGSSPTGTSARGSFTPIGTTGMGTYTPSTSSGSGGYSPNEGLGNGGYTSSGPANPGGYSSSKNTGYVPNRHYSPNVDLGAGNYIPSETIAGGGYTPSGPVNSGGYLPGETSGNGRYLPSGTAQVGGYTPYGNVDGNNTPSKTLGGRYIPTGGTGSEGYSPTGSTTSYKPSDAIGAGREGYNPTNGGYIPSKTTGNGNYMPPETIKDIGFSPGISTGGNGYNPNGAAGVGVYNPNAFTGNGRPGNTLRPEFIRAPGEGQTGLGNWPLASGPYPGPGGNSYFCCVVPNNGVGNFPGNYGVGSRGPGLSAGNPPIGSQYNGPEIPNNLMSPTTNHEINPSGRPLTPGTIPYGIGVNQNQPGFYGFGTDRSKEPSGHGVSGPGYRVTGGNNNGQTGSYGSDPLGGGKHYDTSGQFGKDIPGYGSLLVPGGGSSNGINSPVGSSQIGSNGAPNAPGVLYGTQNIGETNVPRSQFETGVDNGANNGMVGNLPNAGNRVSNVPNASPGQYDTFTPGRPNDQNGYYGSPGRPGAQFESGYTDGAPKHYGNGINNGPNNLPSQYESGSSSHGPISNYGTDNLGTGSNVLYKPGATGPNGPGSSYGAMGRPAVSGEPYGTGPYGTSGPGGSSIAPGDYNKDQTGRPYDSTLAEVPNRIYGGMTGGPNSNIDPRISGGSNNLPSNDFGTSGNSRGPSSGTNNMGSNGLLYGPQNLPTNNGRQLENIPYNFNNQRIPVGQNNEYSGIQQNYLDPNSVAVDGDDSEAEASVAQAANGTSASASSKGGNDNGRAQTNVHGTYTGSGSFQAQAQITGENKEAQSEVSGGKKGASSSASGSGRNNKSQANVQLGSETGSVQTQSQSNGVMHSSNSQVQGSVKGGMADAQARGPGSTSSQAQIGFTPFKDKDKSLHDTQQIPFVGGGIASAQSSGRTGQSQSQLHGTFKYGITYNGAAQSGASQDKDAVFPNRLFFDKIDVFDKKEKNIDIDATEKTQSLNTEKPPLETSTVPETFPSRFADSKVVENETTTEKDETMKNSESRYSSHTHLDHHKIPSSENHETQNGPTLIGNRRSFNANYDSSTDYEFTTDKDENQPDMYDTDMGFDTDGNNASDVEQSEYTNYDEFTSDAPTHESYLSPNRRELDVQQTLGGNTQQIVLGSLKNHNAEITQKNSDLPDEQKLYQPGERIPGTGGYTIPIGFTGSVKSVASKDKTYVVGSKDSPSQAQTVKLTPGTGKIKYTHPSYAKYVKPKDLRSLPSPKENNRYVSVSKSVTRALDNDNNIRKQYMHTYYTKSSSCGYFSFTCTMVSSAEGRKKVCKPKIPTNPDGTPIRC